ncbi:NFX1-type zinc finger-containing protein 1-like isoform X1 [Physella acuta]|uniref:NFX1-type zinc finger-containing protein 1-like isoform X1 n=1 Tax=Physella acuta TaxID=109671 RepID=UPI0027DCA2BB|nr:NFX1-type zinc finger-containing protein 1-like isoform X1 [Physella acuta]
MQRGRGQRGHRGIRGGRPQGQYRQTNANPEGLGYMKLKEWADLEDNPSDLLLYMTSYLPQISLFLNIDNISHDKFVLFAKCLNTVWKVKFHDNNFQKILSTLVSSSFYTNHAFSFLENSSGHTRSQAAETVLLYIHETARRLPDKASGCYKVLCFINSRHVQLDVQATLLNEVVTCFNSANQRQEKQEKRKRSRWADDDEDPPSDIRDVSIYPTQSDFDADLTPYLRANKISGAFRDKNHYLDVMFRLLREDLIQPLREAIHQYRLFGTFKGDPGIIFYENVKILGLFVNDGVEHTLRLDKQQLDAINWDPKNHFMPGNLVCLSKNKFQTIFYAIVTRSEQQRGHVAVKFQNRLEEVYGLTMEDSFVMTESPSYFEGYRYVLEGLQEMVDSSLPFEPYLVRCKREPSKPDYIYPGTRYDLKCLVKPEVYLTTTKVNVLQTNTWLNLKHVCLNDKQYDAVKAALTQQFTLLQGPPGTGKTYVSLKIMKTLLENQGSGVPDCCPILVICYTNHALDQFLEGVLAFCPTGIVRVGGNQKCETLRPFNLRAIQRGVKESLSTRNCLRDIHRSMHELKREILNLTNTVQVSHVEIQTEVELKEVIAYSHYDALTNFQKILRPVLWSSS